MLHNILQDILLIVFVSISIFVLIRNRKARYGLIVRNEKGETVADRKQGTETFFGRSPGSDVRIKEPTVSRRQAILKYSPKANAIVTWSRAGKVTAADAVPNHHFRYTLPQLGKSEYITLVPFCAASFVILRSISVYSEYRDALAVVPFVVLLAYLFICAAIRADHTPIVESILCILLTYYVDATLYAGTFSDAILGVSIYTVCALGAFGILLCDLNKIHAMLRFIASLGIVGLIGLNLILASEYNGAYNWISLGGITFQPSELVKVLYAFILIVPAKKPTSSFTNFIYSVGIPALCFVYALMIKDVGCLLQLGVMFLVGVFIQSDNILFSICLILGTVLGCKGVLEISTTAASRFFGWRGSVDTTSLLSALTAGGVFEDPFGYGYQPIRAMTAAFKNGGLFGNNTYDVMNGVLAADSDLVTAMLAQRHGWLFLFLLLALYGLLIYYVYTSLKQKTRLQQTFTIISITLIISAMMLNTCGTYGLIPLTGVVNPALSDGMSSAVAYGAFFGVLASSGVSHQYMKKLKACK